MAICPGLNKDDARKKWGEEQVLIWRRSYDIAPPGGESLKDTLARTLPYYVQEILPGVLRGQRTIVAAHGNSLRALVMVLERLSPDRHSRARDRNRRADHLSAECRCDGGVEARSRGLRSSRRLRLQPRAGADRRVRLHEQCDKACRERGKRQR